MINKIGTVVMLILMVVVTGTAQPRQRSMDPEDIAKRQTEQIKEAVGLDAKQEKQVYELNLDTSKKMFAMREEMQGNGFEGMREKMAELRAEQDKMMKSILTDAQWQKYEKYQEERRSRMNRGPGGRR